MGLFKERQEYLETRKLYHDADFQGELSKWGVRRRRIKDNKTKLSDKIRLVTGTKDGDSVCKLAAAQSLQMRLLKARFEAIKDSQIYEIKLSEL